MERMKEHFCWVKAAPLVIGQEAGDAASTSLARDPVQDDTVRRAHVAFQWLQASGKAMAELQPGEVFNHPPPKPPITVDGIAAKLDDLGVATPQGGTPSTQNHPPKPPLAADGTAAKLDDLGVPMPPPRPAEAGSSGRAASEPVRMLSGASLMTTVHFEEESFGDHPMHIVMVPIYGTRAAAIEWLQSAAGQAFRRDAMALQLMCFTVVGEF